MFLMVLLLGVATSEAAVQYVHSDHLGSTNSATDARGVVQQIETYTPFGELIQGSVIRIYETPERCIVKRASRFLVSSWL